MKSMMSTAAIFLAASALGLSAVDGANAKKRTLLALGKPAKAETASRVIKLRAKSSSSFDFGQKRVMDLVGDAMVQDQALTVTAPRIKVQFNVKTGELEEVRAQGGNVRIELKSAEVAGNPPQPTVAICREAVYRGASREITLEGPVTIDGKGKPDSKLLGFSVTTSKAVIELRDEGALFGFPAGLEAGVLVPADTGLGKGKGKAADKPEKSDSEKKNDEANG